MTDKDRLTIKDLQLRLMDKVDGIKSVQDAHVASTPVYEAAATSTFIPKFIMY